MLKMKQRYHLAAWVATLLFISFLLGQWSKNSIATWYPLLTMLPLTPPGPVFGVVWFILYILIAYVDFLLFSRPAPFSIKSLFLTQLLLNWCWMPFFFNLKLIGIGLLLLFTITLIVGRLIILTLKKDRVVFYCLTPYFLWLIFASYLNGYIWSFN